MIKEIPDFLIEMSKQINEQDNRWTSDPIWQVRCRRTRPTKCGYSDYFEIVDLENDHALVATNRIEDDVNKQVVDYLDCDPDDLPIVLESWVDGDSNDKTLSGQEKIDYFLEYFRCDHDELEGFEIFWVEEYEDIVQGGFLTEVDADWFIKRKQHDYPKLYTYVESMYYRPQMKKLRNWIKDLGVSE